MNSLLHYKYTHIKYIPTHVRTYVQTNVLVIISLLLITSNGIDVPIHLTGSVTNSFNITFVSLIITGA